MPLNLAGAGYQGAPEVAAAYLAGWPAALQAGKRFHNNQVESESLRAGWRKRAGAGGGSGRVASPVPSLAPRAPRCQAAPRLPINQCEQKCPKR